MYDRKRVVIKCVPAFSPKAKGMEKDSWKGKNSSWQVGVGKGLGVLEKEKLGMGAEGAPYLFGLPDFEVRIVCACK